MAALLTSQLLRVMNLGRGTELPMVSLPFLDRMVKRLYSQLLLKSSLSMNSTGRVGFLYGQGSATVAIFCGEYENRRYEYKAKNPDGSGTLIDGVNNVGDSTQYGLELAATIQATEYLVINASLGLIEADWDNGVSVEVGGSTIDLSGKETSNVVTESWNLGFNYSRPLANGFDFIADMQMSYRGEQDGGAPWDVLTNDSFEVIDLQIGVQNDRWELMLNIDNVSDEEYYTDFEPFYNFSFAGLTGNGEPARIAIGTLGHPRLVTVSVTYSL